MMRFFIIIVSLLFSSLSHAQSIADLARKAEEEKNPLHIYADVSSFQNGLAIASKYTEDGEYKYGVVDEEGVVYIPVNYDEISLFKEGSNYRDNVYKCQRNGKLGLVNAQDITLLQCEYSSIKHSGEYVYLVKNGKNGYAELKGTDEVKSLIPCIYDKLESYSKNAPMRATYNGKEGMIDGNNKIIIPFEYSNIGKFYNVGAYNMAWVEQDGKYGIYNIDGTVIQPWDIEKAYVMNENSGTSYLTFDDFPDPSTPYIHIVVNGMTGVLSGKTYKTVIPCKYGYISPVINERAFYKANNKWGIMDIQNNSIQEAIYDKIKINNNMLSEAFTPDGTFHNNMYVFIGDKQGMIDKNGKAFIPVKYDSLGVFSENMIVAKCGNLYGYINSNGEECIPLTYTHADNFSEGLAAVKNEKGKYLFIDASGVMVIKPHEYDRVGHFQNGTCKVYRKDKVWEIDREGKKVKDSTKKLEADDTHVGCGNDDMYVENTNYPNDIDTNNTLTPNITPTLSFNDKFFQHQHTRTDNVIQQNERQTKTELKYNEISDLKRQKLNGRIKKIGCDSYNEKEDPNGMGHGWDSYEFEYDNNGMLTKYSYEAPYVGDITFHYDNGKLISSSGYLGGSSFLYQKKDKTTVNIIERDKDGEERIVMTLNFYPNGVIKQKRILSSLVDPYNKETVIRYDTNGIEIDDMPSYGEIISEKRDSHNNWTKRIFRDGREVTRDIEYY
uniref:WG repeat-containing protein n=1 Tax=Prevotella sp. TaxID=59823 RepID=UPI004028F6D9